MIMAIIHDENLLTNYYFSYLNHSYVDSFRVSVMVPVGRFFFKMLPESVTKTTAGNTKPRVLSVRYMVETKFQLLFIYFGVANRNQLNIYASRCLPVLCIQVTRKICDRQSPCFILKSINDGCVDILSAVLGDSSLTNIYDNFWFVDRRFVLTASINLSWSTLS